MSGTPSAGARAAPRARLRSSRSRSAVPAQRRHPAPERRTTWNPGIPGGIPARTTVCATIHASTYGNGTIDATAGIQAAIDACPVGQVVQLSAGNFLVNGGEPITSTRASSCAAPARRRPSSARPPPPRTRSSSSASAGSTRPPRSNLTADARQGRDRRCRSRAPPASRRPAGRALRAHRPPTSTGATTARWAMTTNFLIASAGRFCAARLSPRL